MQASGREDVCVRMADCPLGMLPQPESAVTPHGGWGHPVRAQVQMARASGGSSTPGPSARESTMDAWADRWRLAGPARVGALRRPRSPTDRGLRKPVHGGVDRPQTNTLPPGLRSFEKKACINQFSIVIFSCNNHMHSSICNSL